jgi:hypothetical protein
MNSRIVLLNLFSTFLLLTLVVPTLAQTSMIVVSAGNKFRYSITVSWSSNDPNAAPPSDVIDLNNTQWEEITIKDISGTNITGQTTVHYSNNTENTVGGWVDVNTGNGENLNTLVIPANLAVGDSVYTSSPFNTWFINETVFRTYLGGVRLTNNLNRISSYENESYVNDMYWDKSTGVVVEARQQVTNQTGAYTTTTVTYSQIISSNVWTIPEFPTCSILLLMLIALTSVTMVIARQKQSRNPPRQTLLNTRHLLEIRLTDSTTIVRRKANCE